MYDGGYFTRDYIHVVDCCRAINLILTTGPINDIYNVALPEPYVFRELIDNAHALLESNSEKSEIIDIPENPFHVNVQVKNMHMDPTKLYQLGFFTNYHMDDILNELIT